MRSQGATASGWACRCSSRPRLSIRAAGVKRASGCRCEPRPARRCDSPSVGVGGFGGSDRLGGRGLRDGSHELSIVEKPAAGGGKRDGSVGGCGMEQHRSGAPHPRQPASGRDARWRPRSERRCSRDRCAQAGQPRRLGQLAALQPRRRAHLAFTEQFVTSVRHVSDADVDALLEHASPSRSARSWRRCTRSSWRSGLTLLPALSSATAEAMMTELEPRLPLGDTGVAPIARELREAMEAFAAAAMRAGTVRPRSRRSSCGRAASGSTTICRLCGFAAPRAAGSPGGRR